MSECAKLRLPEQVTSAVVDVMRRDVEFGTLPDRETILAVLDKLEQMRGAINMAHSVLRQGGTISTPIAGNGPTIGQVLERHLR